MLEQKEFINKINEISNKLTKYLKKPKKDMIEQIVLENLDYIFEQENKPNLFYDILTENGIKPTKDIIQNERENIVQDLGTSNEDCVTGDNDSLQAADRRLKDGFKYSHDDETGVNVSIDFGDLQDIIDDIKHSTK